MARQPRLKFGDVSMNAGERAMANALLRKFPTLLGVNVRGDAVFVIIKEGKEVVALKYRAGEDFKRDYTLICAAEADVDWRAAIPKVLEVTLLPWEDQA